METRDWIILGYRIISALLMAAGLWKIMKKCGQKGWYALIPGLRYYKIGVIGGRETDGFNAALTDILNTGFGVLAQYTHEEDAMYPVVMLLTLVFGITAIVYMLRVVYGLVRTFRANRRYVFLWLIAPWYVALRFGFDKNYQPVDLGLYNEDELLAGTDPAAIAAARDMEASDNGLVIHLKHRAVRSHGRKRYLLKDINLSIPNGSLVLLLGGSGAGKTTLINAVIGYEKADADMILNGQNIYKHYNEVKYKIGYVPQQDLLRLNDSVMRTLSDAAAFRLPKNVSHAERVKRVNAVIETLGLAGRQDGLVAKKSGGQRKRISIGMELISDPDLFILDEPDSGLDGVIARELFEKLRAIADEGNIVITITHTPDRVADLFDKVIVLARDSGKVGRLAFYGSPAEAKEFFGRDTMEKIVMSINSKNEGGEGRADEMIEKFAKLSAERGASSHE